MVQLKPLKNAQLEGRQGSRTLQRLYRDELPRVRAAAVAWRNGLGGLLAGLLGFSLIKGRSDVDMLAAPASVWVGALLLAAFLIGGAGAWLVLSAAHGRPRSVARGAIVSSFAAEHEEAVRAQRALSFGILATALCAVLLVGAVGLTWYGPEKGKPKLQVTIAGETICGSAIRTTAGILTLKTAVGERAISLGDATALGAVQSCPST
jgi:hypothetical protein